MPDTRLSNDRVADILDQVADLLEAQGAKPFRIHAYRNAAHTVRTADESVADLTREGGQEALQGLPNIGEGIARVIAFTVRTGYSDLLEQLKGEIAPGELFRQVPGIGERLAVRRTRPRSSPRPGSSWRAGASCAEERLNAGSTTRRDRPTAGWVGCEEVPTWSVND